MKSLFIIALVFVSLTEVMARPGSSRRGPRYPLPVAGKCTYELKYRGHRSYVLDRFTEFGVNAEIKARRDCERAKDRRYYRHELVCRPGASCDRGGPVHRRPSFRCEYEIQTRRSVLPGVYRSLFSCLDAKGECEQALAHKRRMGRVGRFAVCVKR